MFIKKCLILIFVIASLVTASSRLQAQGCNPNPTPFTDLGSMPSGFCQAVAQAYFSGLTFGTSPNTYSPSAVVTRDQMAAFITRTQDSALKRGSRRAALGQWATPSSVPVTGMTPLGTGNTPRSIASDGNDLWVASDATHTVSRIRASDGKLLENWTGAYRAWGVLVARGRIYVTADTNPGTLYVINPRMPAGDVSVLTTTLPKEAVALTTDGQFIWTANYDLFGSISRINPDTGAFTTYLGFTWPYAIVFDGANLWVTEKATNRLLRVNRNGAIIQAIPVGNGPQAPLFDGTNLWIPNEAEHSVSIVRAATGQVIATLRGNGLAFPYAAAFDGERILVTNQGGNDPGSVSLFKAADLSPLGVFPTPPPTKPQVVCSDGINFWIGLNNNSVARF